MNNLHLYIQPQLDSIIDELISAGYTATCLSEPLTNIHNWYDSKPYEDMTFNLDGSKATFKQLLFIGELMDIEYTLFNYSLILQVSTTIEARWEIKQRHEQEDYLSNFVPLGVAI
jgi:hypothetical protein